jgi:hypothetical protein
MVQPSQKTALTKNNSNCNTTNNSTSKTSPATSTSMKTSTSNSTSTSVNKENKVSIEELDSQLFNLDWTLFEGNNWCTTALYDSLDTAANRNKSKNSDINDNCGKNGDRNNNTVNNNNNNNIFGTTSNESEEECKYSESLYFNQMDNDAFFAELNDNSLFNDNADY